MAIYDNERIPPKTAQENAARGLAIKMSKKIDEVKKMSINKVFVSTNINFDEFKGKLKGIAAPVNKTCDDCRDVKFSKEFLASNN